jgi:membrane-bound serine protease (ClpP class)
MVHLIIALIITGIALVIVEMFIPNFGIVGFLGLTALAFAAVLTALYIPMGWVMVVAGLIFVIISFHFLLKWLRNKQLCGHFILMDILAPDKKALDNYEALAGKEGVTDIPLKPFGTALFNGVKVDVVSEGAYVPKGRTVKVVNVENNRVIVRELN